MITFGKGIAKTKEIVDQAIAHGFLILAGPSYYLVDENGKRAEKRFAQGRQAAVEYLDNNSEILSALKEKVLSTYGKVTDMEGS